MINLEVGDIVLCTVDRIVGTVVFVKIENNGEGSIILSEIAPGRIRNLRDYVVPKKKIACKIIRISGDKIDLSLRRVTQKEQKELMDRHNQEKSYRSILKTILGDKTDSIIEQIRKEESLFEFVNEFKKNPERLDNLVGKTDSKKILEIINSQKQKKTILKKEFHLTTIKPNGLELIKKILGKAKNVEVKYISAGRYLLQAEDEHAKKADNKIREIISEIESEAKKEGLEFSIKEK